MKSEQFCLASDDGTRPQHRKRDLAFVYRDQPLQEVGLSGWHCPACGECEFDDGEGKRYSAEVDALSEYERGKTRPPKATVLLLRLLRRHPDLLKEIR